jgi:D-alanyl-D-alanine carboxypeptidase
MAGQARFHSRAPAAGAPWACFAVRRRLPVSLACALAVGSACSGPAHSQATPGGHDSASAQAPNSLQAALDSAVREAMKTSGVAGAQVLVIRDGRTLLDTGFGLGAVASDEPVDPRTRFEIGSVTKQFTAAAVLQLVEQHELSLDDSLGKFVSDYPNAAGITLRQLLWQVSGIPNYTAVPGFVGYSTSHAGGIEGILGLIRDKPLEFTPGTKWMYSNSNYALLGHVVAVASGMSWEQYIREHIFEPAGMTHSTFNDHEMPVRDMAVGYRKRKNGTLRPMPAMGNWAMGAGAIVSTAEDLSRWDDAFFGGRIVSPTDVKLATTPDTLPNGSSTGYGFGWFVDEHDGQARIWHSGGTLGFAAMNEEYPGLGERIIVLGNVATGDINSIVDAVFRVLNPQLAVAESEAAPGEDPAITKLAQEWWRTFASGKIDRSRLTLAMSKALTPALVKASRAQWRALGAPQSWTFKGKRESGNVTAWIYRVTFAGGRTLNVIMALTADGKLAGYGGRPD